MFNAKQILDQFMQAAQGGNTQSNINSNTNTGGGLGALLGNPAVTGGLAGAGGGLLAGLLLGNKKVREVGGKVAAVGAAVGLGAIALAAYKNYQRNKTTQTSGAASHGAWQQPAQPQAQSSVLDFDGMSPTQQQLHSRTLLTVMVAAAKADGHFDERERKLIHDHVTQMGDPEAVKWAQAEIYKPLDVAEIARLASSPEMAAEIYLASLIIIDEQNERERAYLDALAGAMRLDPRLRVEVERQLAAQNG